MTSTDSDEIVLDGITNYVELSRNQDDIKLSAALYKAVAGGIHEHLTGEESCKFAFPSMIITPDIRTECFVVILESRLVVAWRKGMFRKTTEVVSIPLASISAATAAVSSASSTRGALLMTVTGKSSVTFALPTDRSDIADAVRAALVTSNP